jgi:hypothetical protein
MEEEASSRLEKPQLYKRCAREGERRNGKKNETIKE